ncbi:hypothetical protein CEXT_393491, partial [Caerostris extrusa]
ECFSSCTVSNSILIFSRGKNSRGPLNSVEKYDFETLEWSIVAMMRYCMGEVAIAKMRSWGHSILCYSIWEMISSIDSMFDERGGFLPWLEAFLIFFEQGIEFCPERWVSSFFGTEMGITRKDLMSGGVATKSSCWCGVLRNTNVLSEDSE